MAINSHDSSDQGVFLVLSALSSLTLCHPQTDIVTFVFIKKNSFKKSALKQKEWTSVDRRGTRRDGPYVARVSRRECANRGYVLLDLFSNLENKLVHSFGSRKPLPASKKESM